MCESFFDCKEGILSGAARIGEFLREKNRGNGEEQLQPRLSRRVYRDQSGFTFVD